MDLTKAECAMYIGTLNAIVKMIEDEPKLTTKKLHRLLLSEIDEMQTKIKEN